MADPTPVPTVPVPTVKVLPRHRWRHGILTGLLGVGLAAAGALQALAPPVANPKIGLIVPAGLVVAATFLFTAALIFGPYRRGLVYKVAKGTWPASAPALSDGDRLAWAYGARLSVPWGLVFASGIFDAVVYAVQGHWPNLAVAAGCLVLLVVLAPRRSACARFVRAAQATLPAVRAGP